MNSFLYTAILATAAAISVAAEYVISPELLTNNQALMFCSTINSRLLDVTTDNTKSVTLALEGKAAWIGSWDSNFYNRQCIGYDNGHIGIVDCSIRYVAICNPIAILKSTHVNHHDHHAHELHSSHHAANVHHADNAHLADSHAHEHEHEHAHAHEHDHSIDHNLLKSNHVHDLTHNKEHVNKDRAHAKEQTSTKDQKIAGPRASRSSRKQKDFIPSCSSESSSVSCFAESEPECAFEYVYLTNTVTQVWTSLDSTTITTTTITNWNIIGTVAAYVVTTPLSSVSLV